LLVIASLLATSCNNEDTNDPTMARVDLEIKATTALSTLNSARIQATGLSFDTVLLGVTELEFESLEENEMEAENDSLDGPEMDGEDDEEEVEFEGSYVVDLINGTSTPDFGIADLLPGVFEEIELKMGPVLEDGNSIYVSFTYTPDSASAPVRVIYSDTEEIEIEIENENGFNIDAASLHPILVTLNLDLLFADIDLSQTDVDADGVIRINPGSNTDLVEMITHRIEEGMEAGEDEDDDDEIDD
jgi:hypothetical protein